MRVVSALMFFPRGGSSHVARSLARALPPLGHDVTVVSGSLPSGHGDAEAFYAGLDLVAVDFDAGDAPMHPSYEDRADAADLVFARVDDAAYEAHVDAWSAALVRARADEADVLHLHHLTPIHEAAARVAPGVPVVGHLHGTELLMLEQIAEGPPAGWHHASAWADRMCGWAQGCSRLLLLAETQRERAAELLGVEAERCVVVPNGFSPEAFTPRPVDREALWQRHLVDEPRGWRPGEGEGSVRYDAESVRRLAAGTALLCVGRFTEVKRAGLLVRAFARAQDAFAVPASLVFVGGHPGEWEGEHPFDAVAVTGARDVYLAGWHDHDALPELLNAADALVLASVREQFGSVLVEAMGCGLPAIAVDRFGPAEIVTAGETGWLVEPDDEAGLAAALQEVVGDADERARRAELALRDARDRFAWPALAERVAAVFIEVADAPGRRLTTSTT